MEKLQSALEFARLQRDAPREYSESRSERAALRSEFHARIGGPTTLLTIDRAALRERRVVFPDDPRSAAHAYRMLRTQILQQARSNSISTIGVVSAVSGEGKTLTAINLALSLAAEPNQTVLLADLDLRRPAIARTLGLSIEHGLESWFEGIGSIDLLTHAIEGIERLLIAPTMAPVPGSSEALASPGARRLLGELRARDSARMLVLDLPPVLLSDDVLAISTLLDAVVVVVAEGQTRREDLKRVFELLGSTRIVGTVLNRSTESEERTY